MKKYFLLLVICSCLFFYTGCSQNTEKKIQTRISADELTKTEYIENKNVQVYENNKNDLTQKILKNENVDKVIIIKTANDVLVGTKLKKVYNPDYIYGFKEKIKNEVIDKYGNTREITIITSNELFVKLEKLASDIKNNKPITGFFEDIGDMISGVIPAI